MSPELIALALSGLLQALQFGIYSVTATRELGSEVTLGPRDTMPELPVTLGRMKRAINNHFEALILFTLATVVVVLGQQGSWFTAACAWIYLLARFLYVPAYVLGWVPARSLIWAIGFAATMLMILAALF